MIGQVKIFSDGALGPQTAAMLKSYEKQPGQRGMLLVDSEELFEHGRLAVEFQAALEHVVGPQQQIEAVTIGPDDDVEQCRNAIIDAVKKVDSGEGVAILTDMFGGTPSNLAISCMSRPCCSSAPPTGHSR